MSEVPVTTHPIVLFLLDEIDRRGLTDASVERSACIGNGVVRTWRDKRTRPRIDNLEAVANALGFEVVIKRSDLDCLKGRIPTDVEYPNPFPWRDGEIDASERRDDEP